MRKIKTLVSILIATIIFGSSLIKVKAEDVYDVILFWGQSNMVGYAGVYSESKGNCTDGGSGGEDQLDERIAQNSGASKFAELTGIDKDIIDRYTAVNHVNVPFTSNTVYDYSYANDSLTALTSSTKTVGEFLNTSDGKTFSAGKSAGSYSIMESYGTNMMPWFSYEYNKKTGHKVVIVSAANGGEKINHFLPHGNECSDTSTTCTNDSQYIYEAMVAKYKKAISYLQSHNYTIGNKFHVVFQGETDVTSGTSTENWKTMYKYIYNKFKSELGMKFGVIVETARTNGSDSNVGVQAIHTAQKDVINDYSVDVILGSSYPYDRYVPAESQYSGTFLGKTVAHAQALAQANLSVSNTDCKANTIHFTSASLSQIGKESADNAAAHIDELNNQITFSGLTVDSANKIIYNLSSGTTFKNVLDKSTAVNPISMFNNSSAAVVDNSTKVGTGYFIKTNDSNKYTLSVDGDVNSDAKVSISDAIKVYRKVAGSNTITGKAYEYAADVNNDNNITSDDTKKIGDSLLEG